MPRRALLVAVKLAISTGLFAWLWSRFDIGAAFEQTLSMQLGPVALAFFILLMHGVLSAWRWRTIVTLQGQDLPWIEALRLFFIAMFFNQTLSTTIGGDVARVWIMHRDGTKARQVVTGIVLERVAGFLALTPLALIGMFLLPGSGQAALWTLFAAAVALATALFLGAWFHSSSWRWLAQIGTFTQTARQVLFSIDGLTVFTQSMIIHLGVGASVYLLGLAVNASLGLVVCLTLTPPVLLLATFPVTFGGWGLREAALVWLFAFFGIAAEPALAISITLGLLVMAAGLPGAVLWVSRGRTMRGESR